MFMEESVRLGRLFAEEWTLTTLLFDEAIECDFVVYSSCVQKDKHLASSALLNMFLFFSCTHRGWSLNTL